MYKKTLKFNDYDGNPVEKEYYFNLNKAELLELSAEHPEGLEAYWKSLISNQNTKEVFSEIKTLIIMSVGKKSSDGLRFVKNDEIMHEFIESEAYPTLLCDLLTNEDSAKAFFEAIAPKA